MKVWGWIAAPLLASAGTAWAGETPRYEPAPAWVKPAPPVDVTKLDGESPILLVADNQERMADGEVWTYQDVATRMASPEVVAGAGTITMSWQPAKGDLVVHQVEIIRGAEHIDVLAGGRKFTVIRREQQLERRAIDGQLTATLAVEGLRVGDVLRFVASTSNREPALKGEMQANAGLPMAPFRVGFSRARFLWPAALPVRWRSYDGTSDSKPVSGAGFKELTVMGPLPKPPELPGDAPPRFRPLPLIEATTFADWPAVSKTMAPLYATEGSIAPGSDLAREVSGIEASTSDPRRRAAAALQLVQERVRYLYNGMENGNYVPQSPAQTWALRYGDCKAKTLLLLAMLHALKIDAEPALASIAQGDYVPQRLPSAAAFDHVLVHATVDGRSYWLDGTGTGSRLADLDDTPPLRWVLPVRSAGAMPLALPMRAPATPGVAVTLDLDQGAGVGLPTLVHATLHIHGPAAEMVGLAKTQGSKEQKDQMVQSMLSSLVGDGVSVSDYTLSHDPAAAEASVEATAFATTLWQMSDKRYRLLLDRTVSQIAFTPDRARAAWQSIPVAIGAPQTMRLTIRVKLPRGVTGFTLDGDTTVPAGLAGATITRHAAIDGGVITLDDLAAIDGTEVAPGDVAAMRSRVALANSRLLRAVAPASVPDRWQDALAGRRDGRLKPIVAAMTTAIDRDPDEANGYLNRARFYLGVFDWQSALPDLDKLVALDPSAANLLMRADAYQVLHDEAKAAADLTAALKTDPANQDAIASLGRYDIDHGRRAEALARVDERIAAGGEGKADMLGVRADLLQYAGDKEGAIAAADAAVAAKPGSADMLNQRCWMKGLAGTALDTALKDCTKAIELGESPAAALDSRALVYLRMNRLDDALNDIDAALDLAPNQAASHWLRGVIRTRQGNPAAARDDLAAARFMAPLLEKEYSRFGIVP